MKILTKNMMVTEGLYTNFDGGFVSENDVKKISDDLFKLINNKNELNLKIEFNTLYLTYNDIVIYKFIPIKGRTNSIGSINFAVNIKEDKQYLKNPLLNRRTFDKINKEYNGMISEKLFYKLLKQHFTKQAVHLFEDLLPQIKKHYIHAYINDRKDVITIEIEPGYAIICFYKNDCTYFPITDSYASNIWEDADNFIVRKI